MTIQNNYDGEEYGREALAAPETQAFLRQWSIPKSGAETLALLLAIAYIRGVLDRMEREASVMRKELALEKIDPDVPACESAHK